MVMADANYNGNGGGGRSGNDGRRGGHDSDAGITGNANVMVVNCSHCILCGGMGDIVCCDGCSNSYHAKCLLQDRCLSVYIPEQCYTSGSTSRHDSTAPTSTATTTPGGGGGEEDPEMGPACDRNDDDGRIDQRGGTGIVNMGKWVCPMCHDLPVIERQPLHKAYRRKHFSYAEFLAKTVVTEFIIPDPLDYSRRKDLRRTLHDPPIYLQELHGFDLTYQLTVLAQVSSSQGGRRR
eukprot:GHVU01040342.1.p1 GENE.GHVU01040342.1~~GHVU01040342.1.p1  ORF type:complete len:236 (+),score=28.32 GHVU01040342.1:555-1262(+)